MRPQQADRPRSARGPQRNGSPTWPFLLAAILVAGLLVDQACTRTQPQPVPRPTPKPVTTKPAKPTPKATATTKDPLRYASLARFSSAAEFDRYLDKVREAQRQQAQSRARRSGALGLLGAGGAKVASEAAPAAQAADGDSSVDSVDSITNNQEAGVDEGDIVKAAGEYFVILRRGRLFSVRQGEEGRPTLRAVGRCNAYPRGGSRGTWYDEMLIHGRQIVVIGYSYRVGGTEIGLFRLAQDGSITHEATHFLRSNDYYSSRNYASRLVGSTLIFYMPYYLHVHQKNPALPAVTSWEPQKRKPRAWKEILAKVDVYRPVQRSLNPTLHTVVQCDLAKNDFDCTARAVIGNYSRTFYVSRDSVYVWVGPGWDYWGQQQQQSQQRSRSYVYRMPILGQGDVTAVRASGNPIDQFSFKESADGHLNVLLTAQGGGDWMWSPERTGGKMALLRVPLSIFSGAPEPAHVSYYTPLPKPEKGYALQNRFVGDWVLWGAGAGWWNRADNGGTLFATNVRQPLRMVREISLDHGVDRIEAMGKNAVAVGSGKQDLFFTSVELGAEPEVRNTWVRKNAAQGETRSHGFFFLPTGRDGSGMLGLPVRTQGRPGQHLVHGSAEVLFLRVSDALRFTPLGALGARESSANDKCVVSCVDWYGNARPIFYRGRVFALLGYELVEGSLDGASIHERGRLHYL